MNGKLITKDIITNESYMFEELREMQYKMVWHINELCNLRCAYCFYDYFTKESEVVGKYTPEQINDAFLRTERNWHLFISGGETMLYPRFNELITLLQKNNSITISSNLSNKNVERFAEEVSPYNFYNICASFHYSELTDSGREKFINNYHLLREKKFPIIVTYVVYPPSIEKIEEDFKFLKSHGIKNVHPISFRGVYNGMLYPKSYTNEEKQIIKNLALDEFELFSALDGMNFYGRSCKAGMDYFHMEIDGEVYNCGTIRESRGNLFKGTFKPNNSPIVCSAATCSDYCFGISSLVEKPETPKLVEVV
jgi:MoaA/NifB/PqqE/SkfB family radical SAM enzyme